ncbi:CAP-Gly domain protein [Teladorsagia circumcincta]|uniref:CAP-Gly domain protein n=1 Tax=Teladorsagia circumcincta TaxID=45464 RepID=A0A2G9UHP2_TELCI|nr:CAP-Gly domain protein [Teladorsagia circumcincta]
MGIGKMTKTNNAAAVVTSQDIGSFVSVKGVGKGVLHYVGEIHGKDGLYCGIELDTPTGKHNGTYQGVVYFVCPPHHGIFAPLYRVELDEIDDVPMMAASQTMKGQERLSRSALPALQLRNVFRPEDPMQTSIASEQFMEGSTFSNASWGDGDAMVCSHATYIVPPGRSALDEVEDCDLMSIPAPKSILSYREREPEEEVTLGTSVVLDESRVGVENLPVVEDDDDVDEDDLQTPLVEAPQWHPMSSFAPPPSIIESMGSPSADGSSQDTARDKDSSLRANSRQSDDTGYNDESDASRLEHDDPIRVLSSKRQTSTRNDQMPAKRRRPQISGTLDKADHFIRSGEKLMTEQIRPPPPPKFPLKPKPPSKHQLLMEQIKASIEADKLKPKKEIKARVSLLPPPRPPPPPQNENTTDEKMLETPKRVPKQPLKTVNASPPKQPPVERPKKERKPLYVPPPPKERKVVKTSTPHVKNGEKTIDTPNVSRIEETPSKAPSAKAKEEKLRRLRYVTRACDALCVVISRTEEESSRMRSQLEEANEKIARQSEIVDELRSLLAQREKLHHEDVERHRNHNDQVTRSHADAVQRLKERYEQQVVISMDEKIAEGEKLIEQLTADKKALQTALANDSDQRNQASFVNLYQAIMLTKEINSLQTALEFKSSEMKELRQKYQQVALRVEEIPVKELEITKLKHKVIELKQALDQKLNYEKYVYLSKETYLIY